MLERYFSVQHPVVKEYIDQIPSRQDLETKLDRLLEEKRRLEEELKSLVNSSAMSGSSADGELTAIPAKVKGPLDAKKAELEKKNEECKCQEIFLIDYSMFESEAGRFAKSSDLTEPDLIFGNDSKDHEEVKQWEVLCRRVKIVVLAVVVLAGLGVGAWFAFRCLAKKTELPSEDADFVNETDKTPNSTPSASSP